MSREKFEGAQPSSVKNKQEIEIPKLTVDHANENRQRKILSPKTISDNGDIFTLFHTIIEANKNGIPLNKIGEMVKRETEIVQKQGKAYTNQPKLSEVPLAPDLSEVPLWGGRKLDGMPLAFIEENYGQYLSAFGAEQDSVFQDQIRAHDPIAVIKWVEYIKFNKN